MATVLITGGTGMIGKALTQKLVELNYNVIILTRKLPVKQSANIAYALWDIEKGTIDDNAIANADYIVHLAGANVAKGRWTEKRKKEIVDSRVKSGELLVKALSNIKNNVKAVISASAIGWYGPDRENRKPFVETDPADSAFLGQTSKKWEEAIEPVQQLNIRGLRFRIGIVLSNNGGAYAEFKKPINYGAATILGSGKQIISWIHIHDLVRLFIYAIENENLSGVFNAVAPKPVTNKEMILEIAKVKGGFYVPIHVPSFALKMVLGEMSIEVLKSATVSNKKIEGTGFAFKFSTIDAAIKDLNT